MTEQTGFPEPATPADAPQASPAGPEDGSQPESPPEPAGEDRAPEPEPEPEPEPGPEPRPDLLEQAASADHLAPSDAVHAVNAGRVHGFQPGWLADLLTELLDRLSALEGK